MFKRNLYTGVTIERRGIKAVQVKMEAGCPVVHKLGEVHLEEGVIANGVISRPEAVKTALTRLVQLLGLKNAPAVTCLPLNQVYTRRITMPAMSSQEMRQAAAFQASALLGVEAGNLAVDIFALDARHHPSGGGQREIFVAAARRELVETYYSMFKCSGLKLECIEIETLALNRLLARQAGEARSWGILYLDLYTPYIVIYRDGYPVLVRLLHLDYQREGGGSRSGVKEVPVEEDRYLAAAGAEAGRILYYYLQQNLGEEVERLYICGPGAGYDHVEKRLGPQLPLALEIPCLPEEIKMGAEVDPRQEGNLLVDYPLPLGLALWGEHHA